jgi:hypothetical protein
LRSKTIAATGSRTLVIQATGPWLAPIGTAIRSNDPATQTISSLMAHRRAHDGAIGTPATGYSILKADSLDKAVDLAKGCPVLTSGGKITVYEIHPAM